MDKFFTGIGEWFGGIFQWAVHQGWLMSLVGAGIVVMFIIALFSDD